MRPQRTTIGKITHKSASAVAIFLSLMITTGSAQLVFSPGTHALLPDTPSQSVDLFVNNQGSGAVPVDALNFILQIGGGGPAWGGAAAPSIEHVDLHTGTVFNSNFSAEVDQGSTAQLAQLYITTSSGAVSLSPGLTKLATVTLNTQGFTTPGQSWSFDLAFNVPSSGFPVTPSDFVFQGAGKGASLLAGEISIVPEPTSALPVAALMLLLGVWWRWKTRIGGRHIIL